MTDLVPLKDAKPAELFVAGGLDHILKMIEQESTAVVFDASTAKGRRVCASAAAKVAKSKTYIDGLGKDYVAEIKAKTKAIDAERKKARDFLDDLKQRVRQPLTEWEEAEKKRIADLEERMLAFSPLVLEVATSAHVREIVSKIAAIEIDEETWGDMREKAQTAKDAALYRLNLVIDGLKAREDAAARAEQERKKQEEVARKAREERIAKEAAEEARRKAEANSAAAIKKREEEERRAAKARERKAAKDAAMAKVRAQAQAKQAAEEAVKREQERILAEQRREEQAAKDREANQQHRAKINGAAKDALISEAGLDEAQAIAAVTAIARGQVPNVTIRY